MYCSGILLLSLYNGKSVVKLRTVQNGIPVMDYKTEHVVQFMPDFENFWFLLPGFWFASFSVK